MGRAGRDILKIARHRGVVERSSAKPPSLGHPSVPGASTQLRDPPHSLKSHVASAEPRMVFDDKADKPAHQHHC